MGINIKVGNYSMPSQVEVNRYNIEKIVEYLDEIHLEIATHQSLGLVKGGAEFIPQALIPVRIDTNGSMWVVPQEIASGILPMNDIVLGGGKTGYTETDTTFAVKISNDYQLYVEWDLKEYINYNEEDNVVEIGTNAEIDGKLNVNDDLTCLGDLMCGSANITGDIHKGGSAETNEVLNKGEVEELVGNWEDITSRLTYINSTYQSGYVKVNKKLKLIDVSLRVSNNNNPHPFVNFPNDIEIADNGYCLHFQESVGLVRQGVLRDGGNNNIRITYDTSTATYKLQYMIKMV